MYLKDISNFFISLVFKLRTFSHLRMDMLQYGTRNTFLARSSWFPPPKNKRNKGDVATSAAHNR